MKSLKVIKIVSAIVLAVVLIACLVTMIASSYYGFNEMYAVFSVFLSVGLFIFAACVVFLLCSIVAHLQHKEEREEEKDKKEEKKD